MKERERAFNITNEHKEFDRDRLVHAARVAFEFAQFDLWEEGEIEKAADKLVDAQGERAGPRGDDELDLDEIRNDRWRLAYLRSVILYERGCKVIRYPLEYMNDHWLRRVWEIGKDRFAEGFHRIKVEWYRRVLEVHSEVEDRKLGERWYPKLREMWARIAQKRLLERGELDEPVFNKGEGQQFPYIVTTLPTGRVGGAPVRFRPEPQWEFVSSVAHTGHDGFRAVAIEQIEEENIKFRRPKSYNSTNQ